MKKTLIIFDVDGTLVFSNKVDSQCFADTYQRIYRKEFPSINWLDYPHVTDYTIFNSVIKDQFNRVASEQEREDFKIEFVESLKIKRKTNPEEFYEVPAAKSTVDKLLEDPNYIIGIGTGGWLKPALLKLNFVGINTKALILSAADNKPTREDILNHAINQARIKNNIHDIIYVGDASWDVRTTRNMNMKFVGIRRNGDLDFLKNLGAVNVMSDYSDYDRFIWNLKNAEIPKKI